MSQFQVLRDQALEILKEIQKENSAIDFSSLTYADGRLLATTIKENIDENLIACAETVAFYISSNLANHLTRGEVKKILINGNRGNILIQGIGRFAVLTTVIKKNADIKKIANAIEKHLKALRKIEKSYEAMLKQYQLPPENIISTSSTDELPVSAG